ncbi:MAG: hypothetical protein WCA35_00310 [Kovacikia sp.]
MFSQSYRHQIIRLNGSTELVNKYQLQVSEISQQGHLLQRARWNFKTFRGLQTFLEKNFPDSYPLAHTENYFMQFHLTQAE